MRLIVHIIHFAAIIYLGVSLSRRTGTSVIRRTSQRSSFDGLFPYALELLGQSANLSQLDGSSGLVYRKGNFGNRTVEFSCESYESSILSVTRLVSFKGAGVDVFNLLALPRVNDNYIFPVPILGIDVVVLPGVVLAAIDFQPSNSNAEFFNGPFYKAVADIQKKWSKSLPPGGALPEVSFTQRSVK